ncbi:benzaldehyde dehydrogenase [Cryptosporangium phraense]|uniref:Aldehyde dehydrogenase family protein n=1 Tax=Cryptosporangium phraense TaxID=2593070 RepID=A0A545AY74_9ACTN|nr:benzaldehyde dehydrogenase [Cryptosporangium phraense]TQS46284.1 aldehyde dehydrogenase family protein [Cryptosporangium phraense]
MGLLDSAVWEGKIYLDGWTDGGAAPEASVEPATGKELGLLGRASVEDVRRAAASAAAAQKEWAARPYTERAAVLRRAGDLFQQHAEEISGWLVREGGAIPGRAGFEIETAAQECYEAAALASTPFGEVLRSSQPRFSMARQLPVGVVGVIAPFNVPVILAIRAVAPALALGNSVLFKPDPRTAVCGGVSIVRVLEEAGLPAGVLSLLPGGVDVGEAVITDPLTRVIAFTGSTRAGRRIGELAGKHLKRAHLELGGNSAMIVLDDVDPAEVVSAAAWGSFFNQGQVCMTTGRHLVSDRIADEYIAALAERADHLPVGDPATEQVALGPIIDVRQRDNIHARVTASVEQGARLAAGGTYEGLFYRPTVLADIPTTAPGWAEEIFGPVAPVRRFSTVDEAIALAADSEYGLSLGIMTRDVARALEIAAQIPSGAVHINDQTVNDEATIPFGGVGESGTGSRHGGARANLEAFTETQWVTLRSTPAQYPF